MNRRHLMACFGTLISVAAFAQSPSPATVKDTQARIAALKAQRTRLQDALRLTLSEDAKLDGAPKGDVLIGVPSALIESIVSEAITGPLRNVRLTLKDVVKVELADEIRTKTFLGMITLGRYELTVNVREVHAVMKPKTPHLEFGSNRIRVDLPVSVDSGDVKADLIFKWDGRKLAGVVCGDLSKEHELQATVPPVLVRLRGRFDVAASKERVIVKPVLAPVEISFNVQPHERTWQFIEDLIESKNAVCEAALRKAAVGEKVKALVLAKGFKVKLPTGWVRTMALPAAFRDTVEVKGRTAGLAISPTGVSITKTRVWYGASVAIRKGTLAPAAAAKAPEKTP
jgi:hypothetical protein